MAEALNGHTKPPWSFLLPEKGNIALKDIPLFPPDKRCSRITGSLGETHLNKFEGIVLGASGKTDISLLKKKGFSWCYAFASIPSLKSPLWCISTENRQVSAMGLDLYTPQRWFGKMAKHFARGLDLPRSAFGFPARLLIGLRQPATLVKFCRKWTGSKEIFFNFSQGAKGPFRKTTIQVVEKNGSPALYIKAADTKKAGRRIDNEARVLTLLNSKPLLAGHIPDLLFFGDHGNQHVLAQSVVQGTSGPNSPDKLLYTFLTKLVGDERVPLNGLPFWRNRVQDELVPCRFDNLRAKIKNSLAHAVIPKTIMHGDFAPWNVFVHKEQIMVIDWESCEPEGLPFFDIFHYVLRYGFLVGHWPAQRALKKMRALINSALFRGYMEKINMDMTMAWIFLELYLIVSLGDEDVRLDKRFRDQHLELLKVLEGCR